MNRLPTAAALALSAALAAGCGLTPRTEGPAEGFDSAATTAGIKTSLAADAPLSLFQIEVETFRDVVQLSGFVDSEELKTRAGEIASRAEGVARVENDLIVKPDAPRAND